jgi:hypothetical protein
MVVVVAIRFSNVIVSVDFAVAVDGFGAEVQDTPA